MKGIKRLASAFLHGMQDIADADIIRNGMKKAAQGGTAYI